MSNPHGITFTVTGSNLRARVHKRIGELETEVIETKKIEEQDLQRGRQPSMGGFPGDPMPRTSKALAKQREDLVLVSSLIDETKSYEVSMVDLARLDLIDLHR